MKIIKKILGKKNNNFLPDDSEFYHIECIHCKKIFQIHPSDIKKEHHVEFNNYKCINWKDDNHIFFRCPNCKDICCFHLNDNKQCKAYVTLTDITDGWEGINFKKYYRQSRGLYYKGFRLSFNVSNPGFCNEIHGIALFAPGLELICHCGCFKQKRELQKDRERLVEMAVGIIEENYINAEKNKS